MANDDPFLFYSALYGRPVLDPDGNAVGRLDDLAVTHGAVHQRHRDERRRMGDGHRHERPQPLPRRRRLFRDDLERGGRRREAPSWPTGAGARGGAARGLVRSPRSGRALDGPPDELRLDELAWL